MKQVSGYSPLLRAFTLLMAFLIFVLIIFAPINNGAFSKEKIGSKITVANASYILNAEAPSSKQPLPKSNPLNFVSGMPELRQLVIASEMQDHLTIFFRYFVLKVSFIFISTQGP